ncbi:hypothetical protein CROQUDRAFT_41825 [Cronartium quercuum f. sp. fusiforme G11]|uniref:Cutinase n=1 Tax=Cronartium quercuum f. sp. fusiforme G11 TaxID=708437 RepID=A0A9P6NLB3_9BASI|nr:hypothetical protein CROQUDRAFT_41825 [Cronartium quercuum f. sp. fusiforme G11]
MAASNGKFFLLTIFFSMFSVLLAHPSNKNQFEKRQGYNFPDFMGGAGKGLGGMMGGALQKNGGRGDGCKKYKIISARGTGENQLYPTTYAKFISEVLASVPDGGNYEVFVYPATVDYVAGPGEGAADAMRYISGQKSSCPKQVYVLIGYSEGAMVVTQLLKEPELPASSIVAIVLYGNPYFKGGAPQNACSALIFCFFFSGKTGAGVASETGISMPSKYSSITFDCCATGDMVCQTIGSMVPHVTYSGSENEKAAVRFTVSKLHGGQRQSSSRRKKKKNTIKLQ